MTIVRKTTTYQGLALLLGAVSLVAVACGDDDASGDPDDSAGASSGGSDAGKPNGGKAGKGGNPTGGTPSGGTGGNPTGGSGGAPIGGSAMAGESMGGDTGVAGDHSGSGSGGEGMGGAGIGGQSSEGGAGGDVLGGGEGGAGGAPAIVADTLDNGTFGTSALSLDGWQNTGDTDAAYAKWHWIENVYDSPGLAHWRAAAYKVTTSQVVEPLPNGTYSFSMVVQRGPMNEQYLFARGCTAGSPDAQVTQSTEAATASGFTKITLSGIQVTSGACRVGIYTDAAGDGWANMDSAVLVAE
jgi:hypothetical protein